MVVLSSTSYYSIVMCNLRPFYIICEFIDFLCPFPQLFGCYLHTDDPC